MTRKGRLIKSVLLLSLIAFVGAFAMGCGCFKEATAEPPKTAQTPPPPPPPKVEPAKAPVVDCSTCDYIVKKAEAAASVAEAAAKKAELAAQKAEAAAARAEKAAEKAEAAANKAEAIFMKKMKK
jgi:hypothetical protein